MNLFKLALSIALIFSWGAQSAPVAHTGCIRECENTFDTQDCGYFRHASQRRACERQRTALIETCLEACSADCHEETPVATTTSSPPEETSTPEFVGTLSGCDYQTFKLECPPDTVISGGALSYGRWDKTICPPIDLPQTVDSYYNETYPLPATLTGTKSVTIDASQGLDSVIGHDPIPGVVKQVLISYTC